MSKRDCTCTGARYDTSGFIHGRNCPAAPPSGEGPYKINYGLFGPLKVYTCVEHGRQLHDRICDQCGDELPYATYCPESNVAEAFAAGQATPNPRSERIEEAAKALVKGAMTDVNLPGSVIVEPELIDILAAALEQEKE